MQDYLPSDSRPPWWAYVILAASLVAMAAGMCGCKTIEQVRVEYRDSVVFRTRIDSVLLKQTDSVLVRDKGDTVFVERWRTEYRDRLVLRTDTAYLTKTETVEEVREVRHVPNFYKWCTGLFWALVAVAIIRVLWKLYRRVKH